ncbi:hypothetical protein ALC53_09908 [Atta colombica]|uniref:Mos1 transposase HTH domain-containing protein n=1 Tax=Atta colombica TaxID=520822 RepID=A0A151I0V3_9HYME|nr:hypothetical protein ALC53_09908 [Atta colombica]
MKKSAAEAHRMLSNTYGEAAISERTNILGSYSNFKSYINYPVYWKYISHMNLYYIIYFFIYHIIYFIIISIFLLIILQYPYIFRDPDNFWQTPANRLITHTHI